MSGLFEWVPISRGTVLQAGAVMSGRTGSDGDVYVGRNKNQEIGKLNLDSGKMYNIWSHSGGSSDSGDLLVLRNGALHEWKPFKSGDPLPRGAVFGGMTATDGSRGVYVARERHGACGKLNLNDDGTCCNLWVHGAVLPWKEGDILVVKSAEGFTWDPTADCDGIRAEARASWLQKEQGKSVHDAQNQVMREFPMKFGLMWKPEADCDGRRAEDRSSWLQKEQGMTVEAAQAKVMSEFPAKFV